ncbi:MAG: O-antigen ligase family protein [Candidatus Magasanikbacteria bacterium]|nr:O-antigen ligase family protein [Candidatus Magasanikbacteria bacterium]
MGIRANILQRYAQSKVTWLLIVFFIVRIASLATYQHSIWNQSIGAVLVIGFACIAYRSYKLAWIMLLGELLLGGSGKLFELFSFGIRTWYLGILAIAWIRFHITQKTLPWKSLSRNQLIGIGLFAFVIAWSMFTGLRQSHEPILILQDAILYGFFFLLFPALDWKQEIQKTILPFFQAHIAGSAVFSLVTLCIYSSGIGSLPDTYYHWFRNVVGGKITDLGSHFFRIVISEHILIVPIILILLALLLFTPKKKLLWGYLLLASTVLVLNFSRIYFLALACGVLVLMVKHMWTRWVVISSALAVSIVVLFCSLFFLASRGTSIGLELVGIKLGGATIPASETSGAIRLAILPDAFRQIQAHPIAGSGLGATVTYSDLTSKETVTRTQFDWGYLEMMVELGGIGLFVVLLLLAILLLRTIQLAYTKQYAHTGEQPMVRGFLAGAVALGVMNLTTPALFHGFGVLFFVSLIILCETHKQKNKYLGTQRE